MFLKLFYRLLLMCYAFEFFSEIEVTFPGFEECWGLPLSLISETSYKEPDGYQAQPFVLSKESMPKDSKRRTKSPELGPRIKHRRIHEDFFDEFVFFLYEP